MLGGMTAAEPATANAVRKRLARETERRREAVALLRIAECGVRYAISELSNGTGPAEARDVAVEMASELSMVVGALRRLTRLSGPERRSLARRLVARGMSQREVADRLGVSTRTVWAYVRPGPGTS
jgi:DNA-directed RNA polymerase specialized sigma24 family protein